MKPDSHWLVLYECRYEIVRVSLDGEHFFAPGQDVLWHKSAAAEWIREIDTTDIAPPDPAVVELLDEREDIKRQLGLVNDNTRRMKEELSRMMQDKTRGAKRRYSEKAAEYGELMNINGQAVQQMTTRLSQIKQQLKTLSPATFESKFFRKAQAILPADLFEQIEVAARTSIT